MPGHTRGSVAYLWDRHCLFTGHGGSQHLPAAEMHTRLESLIEGMGTQ